jgi:hypothetical protein
MGNRDRRGREAKKAKDQRAPVKSRYERTPPKADAGIS